MRLSLGISYAALKVVSLGRIRLFFCLSPIFPGNLGWMIGRLFCVEMAFFVCAISHPSRWLILLHFIVKYYLYHYFLWYMSYKASTVVRKYLIYAYRTLFGYSYWGSTSISLSINMIEPRLCLLKQFHYLFRPAKWILFLLIVVNILALIDTDRLKLFELV